MSPWINLAWKEFWLPFYYRKRGGCPGGRDFVWLTTFQALILTLMLLLLASREGMLNRFVDVLLGNVPGRGVPIWVTNNMLSRGGINGIDTTVLSRVKALNQSRSAGDGAGLTQLKIHPYRSLEQGMHPLVALPHDDLWKNRRPDGSKAGPDFDGWAVDTDDPLWAGNSDTQTLPLEITLSRVLFEKYFDYEGYRKYMTAVLPQPLSATIPAAVDTRAAQPLQTLWMQLNLGFRKELFALKIHWVERLPVIDKIAFTVPLNTYHALLAAHSFPELRYFPEYQGRGGVRLKQILIEMDSSQQAQYSSGSGSLSDFEDFLGASGRPHRGDLLLTFKHPVRHSWVEACARQFNMVFEAMESFPGDPIEHREMTLLLPCRRLPDDYLSAAGASSGCREADTPLMALDVTARGRGFQHAMVYVPDRTLLSAAVEELLAVHQGALSIHPSYQDALNRFSFLSQMLGAMQHPYILFLLLFLVAFLGIQLGTLIGHHRHRYGILLAKGMMWWQVYAMLGLQTLISLLMGTLTATAILAAARNYLQRAIAAVALDYRDTLHIGDLNLLPLNPGDYLAVAATVLVTSWCMVILILWFTPLRGRTHPARLLQR